MTTIAYKNGIIAADTGVFVGNTFIGELNKIFKVEFTYGVILGGVAGDCDKSVKFIEWSHHLEDEFIQDTLSPISSKLRDCEKLNQYGKNDEPFEAFIVVRHTAGKEKIFTYEAPGIAVEIITPFYANGSGRNLALGAMEVGASAKEAVMVASRYDLYTKTPIQLLKFA